MKKGNNSNPNSTKYIYEKNSKLKTTVEVLPNIYLQCIRNKKKIIMYILLT